MLSSRPPRPRRRPIPSCASSSSAARAPARPSTRCSPTTSTRPRRSRSRSRSSSCCSPSARSSPPACRCCSASPPCSARWASSPASASSSPATDNLIVGRRCSSASRSASTTRCSTSAASARSAGPGRDPEAALEAAAATSGRAVLVSGFTVMAAMAGMYLTGDNGFTSMATGTILVVGVAMIGSLTVLPAMLSKLGDSVDRGRIPFLGKRARRALASRACGRAIARPRPAAPARRRPRSPAALLVALAIPAFGLHTANSGTTRSRRTRR